MARAVINITIALILASSGPAIHLNDPGRSSTPLSDALSHDDSSARTRVTTVQVSPFPTVVVLNAEVHQQQRLQEAITRFRSAGLSLPDLQVEFHPDTDGCGGHMGVFEPHVTPWRISICTQIGAVYEHELAHAWELANLSDHTRSKFMEHRKLKVWNTPGTPWDERGVEQAAFVIQQGLIDLPLPPTLSAENRSRLIGYSILTGTPAPRLLRWIHLDTETVTSTVCMSEACIRRAQQDRPIWDGTESLPSPD